MNNSLYSLKKVQFKSDQFKLNINKFEIHRGAIYMISGGISSGKSVFLKLFNNLVKYSGDIKYEGEDIGEISNGALLKDVLYLPAKLPNSFKRADSYIESFSRRYDAIKKNSKDTKALVRRLGASKLMDKRLIFLSPSQKRLISLIAAIAADPKVLIVDDLDSHLTLNELKVLKSVLNRKASHDGVTVISSCRYIYNFSKFASVNITLDSGRIVKVRS